MDSIRLTFSSRRIQALINNTYLASLMSFSFFPYFQLSSYVTIALCADSWIKSNLRCVLTENLMFAISKHLMIAEGFRRTLQRTFKLLWTLPCLKGNRRVYSGCHLYFPFSLYGRELPVLSSACPVALRRQYRRHGSPGWEKNFPNRSKALNGFF